MTIQEYLEHCLCFPGVCLDYPFSEWPVVRHAAGQRRIFALFLSYGGQDCINLKCAPMKAEFWRSVYKTVYPGYHMNKAHWNTVCLNGDVPWEQLQIMIQDSYDLTRN